LGLPREAAQLYERAGRLGEAGVHWEQAGELRRARDLFHQAGDRLGEARVLARLGEPLEAARLYEESGELKEAAVLYEEVGDRRKAAELYDRLGQYDSAKVIWTSLGEWEKLVETRIAEGDLAAAARILEQHGQVERAADVFEQAGESPEALRLRLKLEHWERVVELASRVGDLEQQGRALERLGDLLGAAGAYEQAAQEAATDRPPDEARAAALYAQAAELYDELFEDDRATTCHMNARRYQRLPEITVHGVAQDAFVEYEWNTFILQVENIGYGPARDIRVELGGPFEVRRSARVKGLRPRRKATLEVYVRSEKDQYGPKVPLEITVAYLDRQRVRHELTDCIPVHVVKQGILPGLTTPVELHIGEIYQPGARKDVGDRVSIQRGERRGVRLETGDTTGRVSVRREGPPVQRCPNCNLPVQEEEHRYCPDCGAPLQGNMLQRGSAP
jgi:tetratricopeptide (TPR) repeat protein